MITKPEFCHQARIIGEIRDENYRTRTILLDGSLQVNPGQFIMAWLPGVGEKPFGIMDDDPLSLTIVDVGPFTHAVHQLKTGDRLWIRGPFGNGFQLMGKSIHLVAGGYGTAPLHLLAKNAAEQGKKITFHYGARTTDELILSETLRPFVNAIHISTEDGSNGRKGIITETFSEIVSSKNCDCVYACGPTGMLEAIHEICTHKHIPHQLSWEAKIRCGLGLCGNCEVEGIPVDKKGWLVCTDGPVMIYQ
jgi:dihydroorotate dehydrogenase electron transfer subunit